MFFRGLKMRNFFVIKNCEQNFKLTKLSLLNQFPNELAFEGTIILSLI